MVENQTGSKLRSLILEEATDTILFCGSIVQNIAYQAATIAIEKENQLFSEFSRPTITTVDSNSAKKDSRGRISSKRTLKSRKARQRSRETDRKSPSNQTVDSEEPEEVIPRNVWIPNKVDNLKPPKLESKCNCTVM